MLSGHTPSECQKLKGNLSNARQVNMNKARSKRLETKKLKLLRRLSRRHNLLCNLEMKGRSLIEILF